MYPNLETPCIFENIFACQRSLDAEKNVQTTLEIIMNFDMLLTNHYSLLFPVSFGYSLRSNAGQNSMYGQARKSRPQTFALIFNKSKEYTYHR